MSVWWCGEVGDTKNSGRCKNPANSTADKTAQRTETAQRTANTNMGGHGLPPRQQSAGRAAAKVRRGAGAEPMPFRLSDRRERPRPASLRAECRGKAEGQGIEEPRDERPCTPQTVAGKQLAKKHTHKWGDRWWTPYGHPVVHPMVQRTWGIQRRPIGGRDDGVRRRVEVKVHPCSP